MSGQQHAPATLYPGKDPVPILEEAGWAPGPVWTGGKTRPHRDSIPDRPARSSVAIPTELPGPRSRNMQIKCLRKIEGFFILRLMVCVLNMYFEVLILGA